jgi:hypothetical protein
MGSGTGTQQSQHQEEKQILYFTVFVDHALDFIANQITKLSHHANPVFSADLFD